jgi:hypothetical protein
MVVQRQPPAADLSDENMTKLISDMSLLPKIAMNILKKLLTSRASLNRIQYDY